MPRDTTLSYHAFGEAFVWSAVTPERVVATVAKLAGDSVEIGPLRAGPGGAASVKARGTIGTPVADELASDVLAYAVRLPVDLALEVRVGAVGNFQASGHIELRLSVRTVEPLTIVIDVDPVEPSDAKFTITSRGMQSKLLQRAGDVEGQIREHAAAYVNDQISRSDVLRYKQIDLLPLIESTWANL